MFGKKKISLSELTVQDVICPICLSILIEPVTMPCSHSLCMSCFKQHVSETSLNCPICRMRISVWVRRNTKSNRLANTRLWQMIKEKFASKVEARLQGVEESDDDDYMIPEPQVSIQGEIRQEYEALVEREQKEMASRRSQEEEASTRLIQQLQEEEKMKLRQRQAQEDVARKGDEVLAQQIKKEQKEERTKTKPAPKVTATPTRGPMDVYIGQKTPRSLGKLLVPDMKLQSANVDTPVGSRSPKSSGNHCVSPKTILDYRSTPTSSSSTTCNSHNCSGGSRSEFSNNSGAISRSNSGSSHDSTDSNKPGRQLREITSSQSSESDSEDLLLMAAQINKNRRVPGKENMGDSENFGVNKSGGLVKSRSCSPNKSGKHKKKSVIFKLKNKYYTSEIEGTNGVSPEDMLASVLVEDSDGTDEEEEEADDPNYIVSSKGKGMNSKNNVCESFKNRKRICPNGYDVSSHGEVENSFEVVVRQEEEENAHDDDDDGSNNSSMDYALIFSNEEMFAESLEKMKEEQLRVEERLRQEENDRMLAQALQKQMEQELRQVNRTRGSKDEYALRNRKSVAGSSKALQCSPRGTSSVKRERQTTLTESLAKRRKTS